MLKTDLFDKGLLLLLVVVLAAVMLLLAAAPPATDTDRSGGQERVLQAQARLLFIQNTYAPVESLLKEGRLQEALLKLEELSRSYPSEAHGVLLKASVMAALGEQVQAVGSYAAAVRMNGDYVDQKSPLSRREELNRIMATGLSTFVPQSKAQPDNPTLKQVVRDLYYLKSRLAGGCE